MKKTLTIVIIAAVVLIGASFYGGMKYGQNQNKRGGNFGPGMAQGGGQFGGRGGAGIRNGQGSFSVGELIAKDDKSITLKLADGGSKIILFSDKTVVSKFYQGTMADLTIGQQLMIQGKASAGASLIAESIQIRPATPVASTNQLAPSSITPTTPPAK